MCIGHGHLVKTLSVIMSQCIRPTFSLYLIGLGNGVGGEEENTKYRGTYAYIFLSNELLVFKCVFDLGKLVQSTLQLFHYCPLVNAKIMLAESPTYSFLLEGIGCCVYLVLFNALFAAVVLKMSYHMYNLYYGGITLQPTLPRIGGN